MVYIGFGHFGRMLKVKEGREDEIVHCDYCAVCHHALIRGKEIICAQNSNLFGKPVYSRSLSSKDIVV